jgi:putative toxin-antitoxin system antitoxin component (TIGR02293 family)
MPSRIINRRKTTHKNLFDRETERRLRAERILSLAETVFGNPAKALLWLRGTDELLAGRTPLSLLRTEAGGRVVEGMLWQIDEGVYS